MKLGELLGDPSWLFDLGVPILYVSESKAFAKPDQLAWGLTDAYRIPPLSSLSDERRFAEFSVGWNDRGLFIHGLIHKPEPYNPGLRDETILMSLYLDTRWSPGVHRGTTYCHRFDLICSPNGSSELTRGHGELGAMQRARSAPTPVHPKDVSVGLVSRSTEFELKVFLKADTLTGFEPREFQEVGIFYVLQSQTLGAQCMARSKNSPYFEDPSVWCRGKLVQPLTP